MNALEVIEKQANERTEEARSLVIKSDADCKAAAELSKSFRSIEKAIKDTFGPIKHKAKEAHQEVIDQERRHLAPIIEAQGLLDGKITAFMRLRQEELRQEQLKREEAARKQQEEIRLNQAIQAEKAGDKERSAAILDKPITVSVPKEEAPKLNGFSIVTTWDCEIVDIHLVPREYLIPDMIALRGVARAMKDKTNIPGVRVFSVDSTRKVVR